MELERQGLVVVHRKRVGGFSLRAMCLLVKMKCNLGSKHNMNLTE